MAPQKRKHESTRTTTNKRPKYELSSSGEEDDFWEAECILAERRIRNNKLEYKVQWKGIDPATGQSWAPTWEPAPNVNQALLIEWLQEKATREASGSAHGSKAQESDRTPRSPESPQSPAQPHPRGRPAQKARVIESSPEPGSQVASTTTPSPRAPHSPGADPQTRANTTPAGESRSRSRTSPRVYIRPQVNSAKRAEYERYSQIAQSQAAASQPAPEDTQQTDLDSSQLFAAGHDFSCGIVPDSQDSAGEASYVLTTQASASAPTTQHTDSSPGGLEDDSGLLDIVQAASRAASPAHSIPETVDETDQDSQSQAQRQGLEGPTEIPDTLERVESSFPSTEAITGQEQSQHDQSVAAQQGPIGVARQDTPREEHAQEDVVQQEPVQEYPPEETVQLDAQESAAHQEVAEQESVSNDTVVPAVTQQESPRQEESLQQAGERNSSQATTHLGETESTQQKHSEQETSQQVATQQETVQSQDTQTSQQETIRDETTQQDTAQQQTVQFDLAEDTPQPAQNIHQSILADSENQDTAHFSTSTRSLDVAITEQATSFFVARPQVELSIDTANVVSTIEGPLEAPDQGDIGEPDTPAQVPGAFAQPTRSSPATPHAEQVRAQTPNTASPVEDDNSYITERRNSTVISQPLHNFVQLAASREQNAQLVPSSACLSTQEQEDTTESIRPTIEVDPTSAQTSPGSRHDSSQESPERRLQSLGPSSSPIAPPPNHSFGVGTLSQNVPPRPVTPLNSSIPTMASTADTEKRVREQMEEMKAKRLAETPYTPRFQRKPRTTLTPSAPASETSANNSPAQPKKPSAIPSVNITLDGTRSPSTVPDRSPAPQAPTSLRTVAFANSREQAAGETHKDPIHDAGTGPRPEHAEFVAAVAAAAAAASKSTPPSEEPMQIDEEESSDIDDDGSVLNDDLHLESDEYIVPLFIEGRQSDMYSSYIKDNRELLEDFLKDSQNFEPIAKVEEVLSRMRAIETHMDLVYAEAELASKKDIQSAAQWGIENSAKFRFLQTLFANLHDENKHIVLVTEDDSDALFSILETFCKANSLNFNMPTKGVRASSEFFEGNLLITAFPSTASPIIQAADIVICLDGVQNATKIRQKNWAVASGRVPIIHLVLPRSIGHIERYMSSTLDNRERMNTIVASLAQIRPDIGKPIDEDTPRASAAAKQVATWIMIGEDDSGLTWPLPSIGSVKAVIEFQTQRSPSSSASSAPERTKRPLDIDDVDQAKRMRFTPQPQVVASSYANNEGDTTRISDSVPGTAENEVVWLRQQLQKERAARKAEEERFREHQVMWDKQQEEHESLVREHRLLLGKQKDTEAKLKSVTESKETLQERLVARTAEKQALEVQLKEQQAIGLSSSDEMVVEMTRLKTDLATAQEERQKAVKSAQSTEAMLDYIKEQYRTAQEAASLSQASVSSLTKDNADLSRQASGEVAKLKQIHHDRQFEQLKRQNENQRAEIANLKRFLSQREEELIRAKNNMGRMGVGTRAQSATPAPKTRSRAASPMRVSNLRNG